MATLHPTTQILYQRSSNLLDRLLNESNCELTNVRTHESTTTRRNTALDLVFTDGSDTVTIYYDRVSVNDLQWTSDDVELPPMYLEYHGSVHAMLGELAKWTGFDFTEEDLVDHPVVDLGDGVYQFHLETRPDSLLWTGDVQIQFRDLPSIHNHIITPLHMGYI